MATVGRHVFELAAQYYSAPRDLERYSPCATLRVLGEMGGEAQPAKPALKAKLKDESESVRREAALALKRIAAQ